MKSRIPSLRVQLGWGAAIESPDLQRCLLPLGFRLLPSELEPPLLEDGVPLVRFMILKEKPGLP